jgi:hypothetical protein
MSRSGLPEKVVHPDEGSGPCVLPAKSAAREALYSSWSASTTRSNQRTSRRRGLTSDVRASASACLYSEFTARISGCIFSILAFYSGRVNIVIREKEAYAGY